METVRAKLAEKILSNAKDRLLAIPEQLIKISEARTALRRKYLTRCAEAAHLLSQITGLGGDFPVPKIDFSNLSQSDMEFYAVALKKIRPKDYNVLESCDFKINSLYSEETKLESKIDSFDSGAAVKSVLTAAGSKIYPVEIVEEPEYVRKATSFVVGDPDPEPQGDGWASPEAKKTYYGGRTKVGEKFSEKWYEDQKDNKEQEINTEESIATVK